jgi:hypothetical protein
MTLCIHGELPAKCDVCGEPPRVCKHGQLARSCNVCELEIRVDELESAFRAERAESRSLRAERDALAAKLAEPNRDPINADALHEIRVACKEIMGDNLAFVDDDFARCLLTLKAERDELKKLVAEAILDASDYPEDWYERASATLRRLASHRPEQKE